MSFTKTAVLPVPPDDAFALITEPERLRRWQAVSAVVDLRAGGEYRWTITPGHVAAGTFREVEPGRRIVFGWGWDDSADLPPDASTVTVTVEPHESGSLVTLVHEGLSPEQEALHAEGWHHYVDRLQRVATTGDAGPDEWAFVPDVLDAVSATEAVLAAVQPVLRRLTPEDQPKPTPCPDFTCHQLVVHLLESLVRLGAMAGGTVTIPATGSAEHKVSTAAAQAIDAWRPVDLDSDAGFGARVLVVELALHGWDIAQATGQTLTLSDPVVAYVRELAETVVPGGRPRGSFGEEVAASPDANALDRLAAYAGRTPVPA